MAEAGLSAPDTVLIDTPSGPIRGRRKEGSLLFAGISYAMPPVEQLRFKAPRPRDTFVEPYDAFKFGPAAPQVPSGGMTDSAPVRWDEDCLSLNVCTPACDNGARAVLVWIHGGGYRTGQGAIPWYNGARFAANGNIVVVSINYRLGALGFADLTHLGPEYASSPVNGIADQILALQWVQDNIAAFGGDPARVTIAGESAGGFSVSTLLGCAQTSGLFHRAIPQSGAAHHTLPKQAAETVTEHFLAALGHQDALGLEAVPAQAVLDAQLEVVKKLEHGGGLPSELGTTVSAFYPAHGTHLLPVSPIEAITSGTNAGVAVLTGSNADETTLWGYGEIDDDKLARRAQALGAAEVLTTYQRTRPDADAAALLIALTTDRMFRMPAVRMAEARASHTDQTWMYLFNWRSRAFGGRLGATHALEIPFAFDNLDKAGVDIFLGPGDQPQHVADAMHAAWCAFINDGNPGWDRYTLERRSTMLFDDTCGAVDDPAAEERRAWDGVR